MVARMNHSFGSVCSGIEAASVAWEPLGFRAQWFAEIESFPAAVLAHHWPDVPNLGDMTLLAAGVRAGRVPAPAVLVGGTPCQAFSVAGARAGLSDPRGQLTISYVELADAIDDARTAAGEEPAVIVWENVPGVLTSKDNAFGAFLGLLAGEDCELQPAGEKWTNAGYVRGPKRTIAWRILDAQYFGVAQRRRRVFVVASARADIDPTQILFESDGVRRDFAPSRSEGKAVAVLTANGVGVRGADDNQGQAGHLIPQCVTGDIAHTLKAEGFDGSEDGTGRGTPIIAAFGGGRCSGPVDVAACLTARGQRIDFEVETFLAQYSSTGQGFWSEGCGTLRAREQESHEHLAVMAVHGTQDPDTNVELAHTLGRNNGAEIATCLRASTGGGDKPYVLHHMAVRRLTPRECERLQGFPDNHTLVPYGRFIRPEKMDRDFAKYLMRGSELSFEDCCRRAADGPRYKAIGNSMAVPVMRWIGERIMSQFARNTLTEDAL